MMGAQALEREIRPGNKRAGAKPTTDTGRQVAETLWCVCQQVYAALCGIAGINKVRHDI